MGQHEPQSRRQLMVRPLTDYERRVWKESAEDIIAHPENTRIIARSLIWRKLAADRLRYEATLQVKDAQIRVLATALRDITEMTVCDALGEPFHRAQQVAHRAIREVANGWKNQ